MLQLDDFLLKVRKEICEEYDGFDFYILIHHYFLVRWHNGVKKGAEIMSTFSKIA